MTPEPSTDPDAPPGGVLAALPRTRPQRATARREAARTRAQSETVATASGDGPKAKPRAKLGAKPSAKTAPKAKPKPKASRKPAKRTPPKLRTSAKQQERAPKQGYEPEEEVELGNTVHPPTGGELIESIADIFSELAGAGASAGGRLLKDALSIFRRP